MEAGKTKIEEAKELIKMGGEDYWVSSLDVGEKFKRNHKDVMAAFYELQCSEEFRGRNFTLSSYMSRQGKELPAVMMNQKGFSMLAMGFTGRVAAEWREAFIEGFDLLVRHVRGKAESRGIECRASIEEMAMIPSEVYAVHFQKLAIAERMAMDARGIAEQAQMTADVAMVRADELKQRMDGMSLQGRKRDVVYNMVRSWGVGLHRDPRVGIPMAFRKFCYEFGNIDKYHHLPESRYDEAVKWLRGRMGSGHIGSFSF